MTNDEIQDLINEYSNSLFNGNNQIIRDQLWTIVCPKLTRQVEYDLSEEMFKIIKVNLWFELGYIWDNFSNKGLYDE